MRPVTKRLLSRYLSRRASLEDLRGFVEDVDWDDPLLDEEERSALLSIEAYITGIDDGFNQEADLKDFARAAFPEKRAS